MGRDYALGKLTPGVANSGGKVPGGVAATEAEMGSHTRGNKDMGRRPIDSIIYILNVVCEFCQV
jgi:hypothetical protein